MLRHFRPSVYNTRLDTSTAKLVRAFKQATYPRKKTISNPGFLVSIETCSSFFALHSTKYSSHYQFDSTKTDKHIFIRYTTNTHLTHTNIVMYCSYVFRRHLRHLQGPYTKFKTYKNVMNYKVICIILQHSCN